MAQTVGEFLRRHGLGEYEALFAESGFDEVADVLRLTEADLVELGIDKMGHRKKILRVLEEHGSRRRAGYTGHRPPQVAPPAAAAGDDDDDEDDDDDGAAGAEAEYEEPDPEAVKKAQQRRRRSNTYTPSSPVKVRSQPRGSYGGDRIVVELIAAKLEDSEKLSPQVKMSICKTVQARGVPIESTVQRSTLVEDTNQPSWHESFEFPAIVSDQTYLVCAVNSKKGFNTKRVGLIAIPTKFFQPFTDETVVDNWFPLKLGQGQRTGEIHLRLRVPGGMPSQVGKAFKVTGVKMESRKLVVEVVEGRVPKSSKGHARSTYVKLTLPDKEFVARESQVKKETVHPKWYEAFDFFTEVKNSQYLLVKLKNHKLMSHKTLGVAKIPLLFFLSLKEKAELDSWFVCKDDEGREAGKVRIRMFVRPRLESERGVVWGREQGYPIPSPVPPLPIPTKPTRPAALSAVPGPATPPPSAVPAPPPPPPAEEEEEEEQVADDDSDEGAEEVEEPGEEEEEDTWDVGEHEEDMTPYSPTKKTGQSGGVYWPPPDGKRLDSDLVRDVPEPAE